jgi:GNAT superfamily N-acetyltransferase
MILIRLRAADDLRGLVPLFRGFFTLHRQFLGNTDPLTEGQAAEMVRESLGQPQSWTIVAEEEDSGRLVGFARWEERDGAFFGRELFVLPEYRGQGIGTRLQKEVERRVREAGGDAFFVSIIPHNQQMLAFAYRRGYETLNTVELRKELRAEQPRRGQLELLGLQFKVI